MSPPQAEVASIHDKKLRNQLGELERTLETIRPGNKRGDKPFSSLLTDPMRNIIEALQGGPLTGYALATGLHRNTGSTKNSLVNLLDRGFLLRNRKIEGSKLCYLYELTPAGLTLLHLLFAERAIKKSEA